MPLSKSSLSFILTDCVNKQFHYVCKNHFSYANLYWWKKFWTTWKYDVIKKQKIKHLWNSIHTYMLQCTKGKIKSSIATLTKGE